MGALQVIGNWLRGTPNPAPARRGPRAGLEGGIGAGMAFPYDAAQWQTAEMGEWLPRIHSPDYEIDWHRDRIVARARDLYRNDGWARGAIGRILDSTIGAEYRLVAKPDWQNLALRFGPGFDIEWARDFRKAAEARWRSYANDVGRYNDVERDLTVSQQFRLALGHKLVDGESLVIGYWLEDRVGAGGAEFATAFQVLDPDRLCNPQQLIDSKYLRGGIEIDDRGVRLAYHIRRAEPFDWYNAVDSVTWDRVPREDADGFRRVIHDRDPDRAGQHRGLSIFAPVIGPLKMLAKYYGVELQAATVASVLGLAVTSPYDQQEVREALRADEVPGSLDFYDKYLSERRDQRGYRDGLMMGGVRIPVLGIGEEIKGAPAARPHSNFSPFTHEMLRRFAAVLGTSAEQVTQDYSEASWSSARAGIVEAEKMFVRRCVDFNTNTATPLYANWLMEAYERGDLPLPRNAPDYLEARTALSRCRWLGAARGWVDPVAERQGAVLGLDAAFDTLENICAGQGLDYEEVIEQRAYERQLFEDHKLPFAKWQGEAVSATEVSQKPQAV